jgi:hypothetical protein
MNEIEETERMREGREGGRSEASERVREGRCGDREMERLRRKEKRREVM